MEIELKKLVKRTPELIETAIACNEVGLPNYFIAGGSVTQLIWNTLTGEPALNNIKDIDIVYFDKDTIKSEESFRGQIQRLVTHPIPIDVVNQATVHEWFPKKFGREISPYSRVEQGIDSWLSAFAIGFRLNENQQIEIYAPYGLEDAFDKKVKPNRQVMSKENYCNMVKSYQKRWPDITVETWV